ncbi:MAG: hypothetical protein ABIH39_04565 [Candidatus Margulisiibacteriota bacterium]
MKIKRIWEDGSMVLSWYRLVILLTVSSLSLPAFGDNNRIRMKDLLHRQRIAVKKDREEQKAQKQQTPKTIIKYIQGPAGSATKGTLSDKNNNAISERYGTPLDYKVVGVAEKLIDIMPEGTVLKCRFIDDVYSISGVIITAVLMEDYKNIRLKGRKIMGQITGIAGEKIFMNFTRLENEGGQININAQAQDMPGSAGLKFDSIDRKTDGVIIKELGTVLYGLGKLAVDNSTAGIGSKIIDQTTGLPQNIANIDTTPISKINSNRKFIVQLTEPIKLEREWTI